jgi:hypothetical protein
MSVRMLVRVLTPSVMSRTANGAGVLYQHPAGAPLVALGPRQRAVGGGERGMAVGKRGVPKLRREVLKDKESRDRHKELAREAKARNATEVDRHVMQAYKVCSERPTPPACMCITFAELCTVQTIQKLTADLMPGA